MPAFLHISSRVSVSDELRALRQASMAAIEERDMMALAQQRLCDGCTDES
jgi:hypothetical protein